MKKGKTVAEDGGNKVHWRWNANENVWRTCMLLFFGGRIATVLLTFVSSQHFFSLTAFLGNSLIFVALHKVSSLHPPSKLLYRCLATSDLLVGLVSQPLTAALWMSVVFEEWRLCRFAWVAASISGYGLSLMSLLTMAAMSVDRLLALLLGLRYKQIVTLKRTYMIVATLCIVTFVATLCNVLDSRIAPWFGRIVISCCLLISIASYAKIFCIGKFFHMLFRRYTLEVYKELYLMWLLWRNWQLLLVWVTKDCPSRHKILTFVDVLFLSRFDKS